MFAKSEKFPELSSIPKFLVTGKTQTGRPIQIAIEKNNMNQIISGYSPGCRLSNKQKDQLFYEGNTWIYNNH
jgi:hypothetical protein